VGLELAQAFCRFGSRVTVVERNGELIYCEDPDVTEAILVRAAGMTSALRCPKAATGGRTRLHSEP
jgi:pyruvate/2-oxoglutarate dehydrogenase complex dihydrolipoamide dehydrogenase (E3) component